MNADKEKRIREIERLIGDYEGKLYDARHCGVDKYRRIKDDARFWLVEGIAALFPETPKATPRKNIKGILEKFDRNLRKDRRSNFGDTKSSYRKAEGEIKNLFNERRAAFNNFVAKSTPVADTDDFPMIATVRWEYEDNIPTELEITQGMYEASIVDGVRLYPYIEIDGHKIYLEK